MFEKLRQIRKEQNVKVAVLTDAIGLKTESAYYKKENGNVPFTLEEALIIANLLNKTVEEVFESNEVT